MADIKPDCILKIKRERSENFDSATLAFLCDEVEKNIDIINSKQTNFITNKRKQQVWQKITDAVNARGGAPRSVSQLKEKYRKSVSAAKIASNIRKKELFKTGGGSAPPPLSDISQKLCEINDDTPSFSGIANSIEFGTNSNSGKLGLTLFTKIFLKISFILFILLCKITNCVKHMDLFIYTEMSTSQEYCCSNQD
ncbi:myb/SANT-like DNA-binding domain-containing protein 4 [Ruditapes philippinarum]|uniref:myb/SANT-like DNA-binding domain-containing protein 4 n=1 Tax=Ruditapes philippinarum TaxID=129788 RepID=UPI00295C1385|nr:myb/SANT-like DNA-binding domain-containing protein 4 [Ruditapes philippinarum]